MSITQGMTGGGSWSGSHTLVAFPSGPGWRSLGRGNLSLFSFATNTQIATAIVLLPFGGPAGSLARGLAIRGLSLVTKPVFWVGVNAFQEAEDAAAYIRGEPMSWQLDWKGRPIGPIGYASGRFMRPGIPIYIPVPFPYLDFTRAPSSGGGGPGELPTSTTPPPSIEETGGFIVDPPLVRDSSKPEPARYALPVDSSKPFGKHNPCDKGYSPKKIKGRWYCVKKD